MWCAVVVGRSLEKFFKLAGAESNQEARQFCLKAPRTDESGQIVDK
jgi:hypothetical protein